MGAQVCCRCSSYAEAGVRIVVKNLPMRYALLNMVLCMDCYTAEKEGRHVMLPMPFFSGKTTFEVEVTPFTQRKRELFG